MSPKVGAIHFSLSPLLVPLFLFNTTFRSRTIRLVAVVDVCAHSRQHSGHSHSAAAEHSAEAAGETAHHFLSKLTEQTAAVHLRHHFAHLFVLAQKLINFGDR